MDAYNIAICLAPTLIPVPEDKRDQVNHQTDTIELYDVTDEEEQEESERQHNDFMPNLSDDG